MKQRNEVGDFWRFVEIIPGLDCWVWIGAMSSTKYGAFRIGGKRVVAHRFSWEQSHGPIAAGMHVLHRCDFPLCVRPSHLFLGSNKDNVADRVSKGRQGSGNAKLSADDVRNIRRRLAHGATQTAIAAEYHVDQTTISWIARGKTWAGIK